MLEGWNVTNIFISFSLSKYSCGISRATSINEHLCLLNMFLCVYLYVHELLICNQPTPSDGLYQMSNSPFVHKFLQNWNRPEDLIMVYGCSYSWLFS